MILPDIKYSASGSLILRLTFIILLIVNLLSIHTSAQIVAKIEIEGADKFSAATYRQWSQIQEGSKIFQGIEDTLRMRIAESLGSEGYYNPRLRINFEKLDSSSQKLIIEVNENSPTIIRNVVIGEGAPDSLQLGRFADEVRGEILSVSRMENLLEEMLTYLENQGRPFTVFKIESLQFGSDSLDQSYFADIFLKIEESGTHSIDRIEIEGNAKTKDDVIVRASRIELGSLYSQKLIDETANRLNRLRFFEPVEPPSFYLNKNSQGILKITVREKQTNSFDGVAGYVPSATPDESGYFTGFVNFNLRNLFGTGRGALIKWQQENRSSQELELRYLEPWLFGYPFNVELGLFQRKQDSTFVQRNFEGKIEYLATEDLSASLILSTQSTIPTERRNNIFTVYNSSGFTTGFNIKIDSRDDYYSPTLGILFLSGYKFTRKSIKGPAQFFTPDMETEFNQQRFEFDFSYFTQLFSRQVTALTLHGRELRGSNLELSDLYLFGGASTLRGYREKQFQGNRIFWSNLEQRFLLSRRTFAFLFLDTGYFLRSGDDRNSVPEVSEFMTGYGFGLDVETGLGVLSVSFALGKGDSFTDGKIHFGIINEF